MNTNVDVEVDSVFGSNFKVRCSCCMATSGWNTISNVNLWWRLHQTVFGHKVSAKFIRKEPI